MKILIASLVAWFIAQIIKVLLQILKNKKVCLHYFLASGGMPSSHTALVIALTTQVVFLYGFDSIYFAICAILSGIVMYDAAGVRRAVGLQAKKINELISKNENKSEKTSDEEIDKEIKEILGHTPFEVLGGFILGVATAIVFTYCW